MKFRPGFPDRFGCVQDARAFGQTFFNWYNFDHHHSGIGYFTPVPVHHGQTETITNNRAATLRLTHAEYPEQFANSMPRPPGVPSAAWINPPENGDDSKENLQKMQAGRVSLALARPGPPHAGMLACAEQSSGKGEEMT